MDQHKPAPRFALPAVVLWASAAVLIALIAFQSVRVTGEARADIVSSVGELTALTVEATNEDLLLVIDGRNEDLLVYRPGRNGIDLIQTHRLPDLFAEARARATGNR